MLRKFYLDIVFAAVGVTLIADPLLSVGPLKRRGPVPWSKLARTIVLHFSKNPVSSSVLIRNATPFLNFAF